MFFLISDINSRKQPIRSNTCQMHDGAVLGNGDGLSKHRFGLKCSISKLDRTNGEYVSLVKSFFN